MCCLELSRPSQRATEHPRSKNRGCSVWEPVHRETSPVSIPQTVIKCHTSRMISDVLERSSLGNAQVAAWYVSDADLDAPASARRIARRLLTDEGVSSRLVDVATLVVDDMVTGASRPCSVHLAVSPGAITVSMHHRHLGVMWHRAQTLCHLYGGTSWLVTDPDGRGESAIARLRIPEYL